MPDATIGPDTGGVDAAGNDAGLDSPAPPQDASTPPDAPGADVTTDSGLPDAPVDAPPDVVDSGNCGAPTQACCAGNHCNGTACCDTSNNQCYGDGITCSQPATVCQSGSCVGCGGAGDACCQGSQCNGSGCCDRTDCVSNNAACPNLGGQCQQGSCQ